MNAIETSYKGYRFRSRLEARWAVCFDELKIPWEYEAQGFTKHIPEWGPPMNYLPDFHFPAQNLWAEVKGAWSPESAARMVLFLDYGCPLPGFNDSVASNGDASGGLLLLGSVPDPTAWCHKHPIIGHHKGLWRGYCQLRAGRIDTSRCFPDSRLDDLEVFDALAHSDKAEAALKFLDPEGVIDLHAASPFASARGYSAARSARFEHGHSGATT